jgi:hypothetical protein
MDDEDTALDNDPLMDSIPFYSEDFFFGRQLPRTMNTLL